MKIIKELIRCSVITSIIGFVSVAGAGKHHEHHNHHDDSNRVVTDKGVVVGEATDYGSKFLGIPYAAPPVGALRWQPTQDAAPWDGELSADTVGNGCPQQASPFGAASLNEDCLFLNVYKPKRSKYRWHKAPVMVWIHGGSFTYGEGNTYDPQKLVEKGVIVVNFNYRLGALGFMAHPALSAVSASGTSGNFGIMDQQAALRWVKNNIAAFGGNPNKVTILGESAGGLSVHAHLASPQSEGLFQRAIIQSGAYLLEQPTMQNWEYLGLGMAAAMGCPDQSPACLMNLDVADIVEKADPGSYGFLPIVDGNVLPQSVLSALARGDFHKVPVIQGTTKDEYSMFVALSFALAGNPITTDNYIESISALGFPIEVASIIALEYPLANYPSPSEAFTALSTDFLFACNSQTSSRLLSEHVRTYAYEFNDPNAPFNTLPPLGFPYGSTHTSEIQYLMDPVNPGTFTAKQKRLSKFMVNYWTSFAKYGTPNVSRAPIWPRFTERERMKSLEPAFPKTINNFDEVHHCGFWGYLLNQ